MSSHAPRHYRAGEAIGFEREKPRRVEVGQTYGNLRVVERLGSKNGSALFACVCTVEGEEGECGRPRTVAAYKLLKSGTFRACQQCAAIQTREHRRRFTRGL